MNRIDYLSNELVGIKHSYNILAELNDNLRKKNRDGDFDFDDKEDVKKLFPLKKKKNLKELDNLLKEKRWRKKIVSCNNNL